MAWQRLYQHINLVNPRYEITCLLSWLVLRFPKAQAVSFYPCRPSLYPSSSHREGWPSSIELLGLLKLRHKKPWKHLPGSLGTLACGILPLKTHPAAVRSPRHLKKPLVGILVENCNWAPSWQPAPPAAVEWATLDVQPRQAFRWPHPQPPTDCSPWGAPRENHPAETSQPTEQRKEKINCYISPLIWVVICYTVIDTWNSLLLPP